VKLKVFAQPKSVKIARCGLVGLEWIRMFDGFTSRCMINKPCSHATPLKTCIYSIIYQTIRRLRLRDSMLYTLYNGYMQMGY
jgi:hypothetical protein